MESKIQKCECGDIIGLKTECGLLIGNMIMDEFEGDVQVVGKTMCTGIISIR